MPDSKTDAAVKTDQFLHGTFVNRDGLNPHLAGKTALLRDGRSLGRQSRWVAQFDDLDLAEAFGWWPYGDASFVVDAPPMGETESLRG